MRPPSAAPRRSRSRPVRRNWPRWLRAQVISMPSGPSMRRWNQAPTLLTSTSSRGRSATRRAARARTSPCAARSARSNSTASLPVSARMAATHPSPLAWWRPTRTTRAPSRARARAVIQPMPSVAPVTRQILPCIRPPRPPPGRLRTRVPPASRPRAPRAQPPASSANRSFIPSLRTLPVVVSGRSPAATSR